MLTEAMQVAVVFDGSYIFSCVSHKIDDNRNRQTAALLVRKNKEGKMKKILMLVGFGVLLPQATTAQVPPIMYAKNALKRYTFTLASVGRCPGVVPVTISTDVKNLSIALQNPYLCSGSRVVSKLLPGTRYVVEDNGQVRPED